MQLCDTLVVTRIDRLAHSLNDMQDSVHELKARGVALRATEQPVDTGTAAGKAFLDMLGVFAKFETNLRRERQLEGIGAAKERGACKGRKPSIDAAEVRRLRDGEGLAPELSHAGSASAEPASAACSERGHRRWRQYTPVSGCRWMKVGVRSAAQRVGTHYAALTRRSVPAIAVMRLTTVSRVAGGSSDSGAM